MAEIKTVTDSEMLEWMQFHGARVAWGGDDEVCDVRWCDRAGQYRTENFADWRDAIRAAMNGAFHDY